MNLYHGSLERRRA